MVKKRVDFQNNWDCVSHEKLFWKNLILKTNIYSCLDRYYLEKIYKDILNWDKMGCG